jgi:hypothetical protein
VVLTRVLLDSLVLQYFFRVCSSGAVYEFSGLIVQHVFMDVATKASGPPYLFLRSLSAAHFLLCFSSFFPIERPPWNLLLLLRRSSRPKRARRFFAPKLHRRYSRAQQSPSSRRPAPWILSTPAPQADLGGVLSGRPLSDEEAPPSRKRMRSPRRARPSLAREVVAAALAARECSKAGTGLLHRADVGAARSIVVGTAAHPPSLLHSADGPTLLLLPAAAIATCG